VVVLVLFCERELTSSLMFGSRIAGVETTRHFLLEWLSYMHRYIPVGLLEVLPQKLNWRPPSYFGRNDLETMMASESAADWVCVIMHDCRESSY
jgi:hypothetical protein